MTESSLSLLIASLFAFGMTLLASCVQEIEAPDPSPNPGFHHSDPASWKAWINAMPGPKAKPTLHVTGLVEVIATNYDATLEALPIDPAQPETLSFRVSTRQTGEFGGQAITAREVRHQQLPQGEVRTVVLQFPDGTSTTLSVEKAY